MVCKEKHTKIEKVRFGMQKRAYQNWESEIWYAQVLAYRLLFIKERENYPSF